MTFNYPKYKAEGKKDSCTFHAHPDITQDEFVKSKLQEVVNYIRDNYDLDIFTKIWTIQNLEKLFTVHWLCSVHYPTKIIGRGL